MRTTLRGARTMIGLVAVVALVASACSKSSSGGGGGGGSSATIEQGAGGLVFSPAALTVKKGAVLSVKNVGSAAHTFTISDQGIDVQNDPGKSQNVTIDLAPGTYTFICRFHVSSGMQGTLTVTG